MEAIRRIRSVFFRLGLVRESSAHHFHVSQYLSRRKVLYYSSNKHYMASTYHIIPPITHQRDLYLQPITALCFDPVSDTLWSGNNSGIVAAYYSARGMRGVSYRVGGNLAVKGIIAGDSLVRGFGISSGGIGAWTKGGVNKWFYRLVNG